MGLLDLKVNRNGWWISLLLITSYLNAVLKAGVDGNMTVFRILLLPTILMMIPERKRTMTEFIGLAIFTVVYCYIISYLPFNRFQDFDIVFTLHYILVPFCFIIMNYFIDKVGLDYLYNFFKKFHYVMLVLAFIQFFAGGVYPNTQNRAPMVNIFFWNENEFVTVLAIFIPLYFLIEKETLIKYLVIFCSLFFIVYSDARLLIIGLVLFFGIYYSSKLPFYKYKMLWILSMFLLILILTPYLANKKIFDDYTFFDLFADTIRRIFTLDDYEGIGSVISRVNAYIWGQIDLYKTYLFGIGPSNSFIIMKEHTPVGLEAYSPKSFHNIILQMIVEIGFLGIFLFLMLVRMIRNTVKGSPFRHSIVIGYYIAAFIFSTILSGAFSNYPFIFIIAFSLTMFKTNFRGRAQN
ncbi:O-antigen ligase family protein [Sphingobacterium sp. ML3W]|uniref:O-antigen ligase family protein n=1 Tax=Sphingobacterium sp. ML3W TaxID=1538644 RepID=UPI00249CDF87|nr:O-antigen ligase family protein [Sphingobacterium sp. ML3W]WFA78189.1 O-antigen ligase family protein [Sphingobacterium sp. ML3W]